MGNYIRAFCVGEEVPPIAKVVQWLASRDVAVKVVDGDPMKMQWRGWERGGRIKRGGGLRIRGGGRRREGKDWGRAEGGKSLMEGMGAGGKRKYRKRNVN